MVFSHFWPLTSSSSPPEVSKRPWFSSRCSSASSSFTMSGPCTDAISDGYSDSQLCSFGSVSSSVWYSFYSYFGLKRHAYHSITFTRRQCDGSCMEDSSNVWLYDLYADNASFCGAAHLVFIVWYCRIPRLHALGGVKKVSTGCCIHLSAWNTNMALNK